MAADGTVCAVIGDATRPRAGFSTLRCTDGLVADLEAYERAHNPDGRELASNPAETDRGRLRLLTPAGADILSR
jgi:hypothetical protein